MTACTRAPIKNVLGSMHQHCRPSRFSCSHGDGFGAGSACSDGSVYVTKENQIYKFFLEGL
jgi:hypothetical protein